MHDLNKQNNDLLLDQSVVTGRAADLMRAVVLAVIYILTVRLSYMLINVTNAPSFIWPADGIAIGFILLMPKSARASLYVGVFAANTIGAMILGTPIVSTLTGSLINTLQVGLSVFVMHRAMGYPILNIGLRALLPFFMMVTLLINAIAAAAAALIGYLLHARPFLEDFKSEFVSDGLGIILATPLIVGWGIYYAAIRAGRIPPFQFKLMPTLEGLVVFGGALLASFLIFSTDFRHAHASLSFRPFVYMCLPFLIWTALRFDLRAVSLNLVITSAVAVYFTSQGLGEFGDAQNLPHAFIELQIYLIIISTIVLITSGLTNEQRIVNYEAGAIAQFYDTVMHASGNLVFEIDVDTRMIKWAGNTEAVLGWSRADIATIDLWNDKVHLDDRETLSGVRKQLLSNVVPNVNLEYRVVRPDGSYLHLAVGAYAADLFDARQRMTRRTIVGLAKDVTAVFEIADEKKKLEAALRQAQKMETVGQMAGGIAHDFNNILAAILGYSEMAQEKLKRAAAAGDQTPLLATLPRYADTIQRAAERGRSLVAQILTFSRRAPERKSNIALTPLLREISVLLRGSYQHDIVLDIESRLSKALVTVGDATALHQLVVNVATNGLQAMSERGLGRGTLSMHLEEVIFDAPHIFPQGTLPPGHYACLKIADEGGGIDDAVRAKMFDPFFTTKSVGRGTGLGLSLALAVARAHGGAIDVTSHLGDGTTFAIYLPIAEIGEQQLPVSVADLVRGRGQSILLVDDEAPLRELASEILTDLGYKPVVFASSATAWEAFDANPALFDLILTDEVMPELTGTQLAERIHQRRSDVPILIITAYGGAGFELRAQEAGVTRILRKPYRAETLSRTIADALVYTDAAKK